MRRQPHECMVACYILFSTSDTMSMNDSQLPLHGMRFDTGRDRRNIIELMWQPMLSMRVVQTNALMAYGCTVQLLPNKRDAIRLVSLKRDPHPQCSEYICEPASGAHPHTVCRTGQLYGPRLAPTHRPALTQALLHTNTLTQAHTCTHPGSPTHTHTHTQKQTLPSFITKTPPINKTRRIPNHGNLHLPSRPRKNPITRLPQHRTNNFLHYSSRISFRLEKRPNNWYVSMVPIKLLHVRWTRPLDNNSHQCDFSSNKK